MTSNPCISCYNYPLVGTNCPLKEVCGTFKNPPQPPPKKEPSKETPLRRRNKLRIIKVSSCKVCPYVHEVDNRYYCSFDIWPHFSIDKEYHFEKINKKCQLEEAK